MKQIAGTKKARLPLTEEEKAVMNIVSIPKKEGIFVAVFPLVPGLVNHRSVGQAL